MSLVSDFKSFLTWGVQSVYLIFSYSWHVDVGNDCFVAMLFCPILSYSSPLSCGKTLLVHSFSLILFIKS